MGQGISEVLTFAVGVAISPVPIIAVILMLFSAKARVNGPVFLLGWVLTLAVVSTVAYVISDQSNASTSSTASDTISWGKIILGVLFLCLAARQWKSRPAPGVEPEMPKWMAGIDALAPGKAFGLGVLLKTSAFDRAVALFAESYANQNERDYETLKRAVDSGEIKVETGV